jgi:hypothetical protein
VRGGQCGEPTPYRGIRKPLEQNNALCRERYLDPGNPNSLKKRFYNPNILKEFDAPL